MRLNASAVSKLKKIAKSYLHARKEFKCLTDKTPELCGNDNLVGRIGEFIGIQFLEHQLKRKSVRKNGHPCVAGYDIIADGKKVSVKAITNENKRGIGTKVTNPWDELLLIEFDEIKVKRIGYIEKSILKRTHKNLNPRARRSMLNDKGLILTHGGKVYSGKDVERYL